MSTDYNKVKILISPEILEVHGGNIEVKIKEIIQFILKDEKNIMIASGLLLSLIFLAEMSITFHVPRYGIIPSIFLMFYCNIFIVKILEFRSDAK